MTEALPDPLSELARQRREQVEAESQRSRPDIVEAVTQSEVIYTLRPESVPYQEADPVAVDERLNGLYGVSLEQLNLAPLLNTMPREELLSLQGDALLRRLVRSNESSVTWSSGRFPLHNDFVKIRTILINFERVYVSVAGTSQIADVIAQEVLEVLWEVAGVRKKYSDLEPKVLTVGYATATRLNLGMPFESMLDGSIIEYLRRNMTDGERFAVNMGSISPSQDPQRQVAASVLLDDLVFRVAIYDLSRGTHNSHELSFSVTAQSDYGQGRVLMRSTLPYEKHVALVTGLFSSLHAQ